MGRHNCFTGPSTFKPIYQRFALMVGSVVIVVKAFYLQLLKWLLLTIRGIFCRSQSVLFPFCGRKVQV